MYQRFIARVSGRGFSCFESDAKNCSARTIIMSSLNTLRASIVRENSDEKMLASLKQTHNA
jgi:hypothetical protein